MKSWVVNLPQISQCENLNFGDPQEKNGCKTPKNLILQQKTGFDLWDPHEKLGCESPTNLTL